MYLAMYKNGSSSLGLGAIDECSMGTIQESFMGDDSSKAIAVGGHVEGEDGSEESLSVEKPVGETFVWRKEGVDPVLSELGDAGWSVELELEKAPGVGIGWMSHCENSLGTAMPCVYWSFRCQQSVAVCP